MNVHTSLLFEEEEPSFARFALSCANALWPAVASANFGDEHCEDDLSEARRRLAEVETMTLEQLQEAADEAWATSEDKRLRLEESTRATRAKYEAMVAKVEAWQPPSPEHVGLKNYMLFTLQESMAIDAPRHAPDPFGHMSGERWKARMIGDLTGKIRRLESLVSERQKRLEQRARAEAERERLLLALKTHFTVQR